MRKKCRRCGEASMRKKCRRCWEACMRKKCRRCREACIALTCMPCRARAASSSCVGSSPTAFGLVKPLFHLIRVPWFTLICRRGKLKQKPTTGMLSGFGLHHCTLLLQ